MAENLLKKELLNFSEDELTKFIRYEAGSSNPDYFKAAKTGGLKLQQVPEEYAKLLIFLKKRKIESYLELGIGNGGSFLMTCFMLQETLKKAVAVDNLMYGSLIDQTEEGVMSYINQIPSHINAEFKKMSTNDYFKNNPEAKFDAIFIDADHSYKGVLDDAYNSRSILNKSGVLIFHDINSDNCEGVKRLWGYLKRDNSNVICHEFIHSNTCGIGVIEYI